MPFEIRIRQNGIFRYRLKEDDITAGVLKAGMHDRFLRFFDMIPDEGFMIAFDPENPGTGFRMLWQRNMREEIGIQLPGLTTAGDIDQVCMCMERVMKRWHTKTFVFENSEYRKEDIGTFGEMLKDRTRANRIRARENYSDGVTMIHGALWPLTLETEKLRAMDDRSFAADLARLQAIDYYWCSCHVYLSDDHKGYQGVFTITAGVDMIIPKEPRPPFGMIDPATGDEIVCDRYFARAVTQHSRRTFLQTDYRHFLELIHAPQLISYDASHYILPAAMEKQLLALEKDDMREAKPCW